MLCGVQWDPEGGVLALGGLDGPAGGGGEGGGAPGPVLRAGGMGEDGRTVLTFAVDGEKM